jgi:two-component system, NarL family, sensor histidine kinase UhpB
VNALPLAITGHIFHIVQEGLTNAVKHAQAANVRAVVRIDLAQGGAPRSGAGLVEATVEDDGAGLVHEIRGEAGFGLGLIGIRERTVALGGEMTLCRGQRRASSSASRCLLRISRVQHHEAAKYQRHACR